MGPQFDITPIDPYPDFISLEFFVPYFAKFNISVFNKNLIIKNQIEDPKFLTLNILIYLP